MRSLFVVILQASLLVYLSSCTGGSLHLGDDDTVDDDDTGDDDSVDDDTGDDDTGTEGVVDNLSWRLHDDYGALVYVSFTLSAAAEVLVEYNVDSDEWRQTPPATLDAGEQELLVVGIPYGTDAQWRVVAGSHAPVDGDLITTDLAPSGLPLASLELADESAWLPEGNFLLTSINQDNGGWSGGTYWTFIIDRQGRPVWASRAPNSHWTLFAQVALSGDHFLWDEATYWSSWDNGAGSTVHRTYLDVEIEEIPTPGLHHTFVQLPGDVLVWGSQDHGGREALVERGPGDPDETVIWTCQEDWPGSGDCESNGLYYRESTDSFLYSFYTNSSIVEVDHGTGQSLWWAGEVDNGYSFDPWNSQFDWQHGVSYTDDDTLLVSTYAEAGGSTTMVREYEVDHDNEALVQVWYYDPDIYAPYNGDAWRLSNGNTLHVLGSAAEIVEVDPAGDFVWHVDFGGSKLLGRGEFIEDLYDLVSPH